ncbi:hypothetical protein [Chryseobacterium sp.]|uniref:hypothetical protein n=1 Tax=Chryseobacterium sp. TaxID=1871047 RepID=UPI003219EA8B
MKKTGIIISLFLFNQCFSQVAIGKNSVNNTSISLEFGNGNRGMILPWVTSTGTVAGAVDGTVIYDASDKKIKYRKSGVWMDLTIDASGVVNTALQNSKTESATAKVTIGGGSVNTTPGILVLADDHKAMVLPKMNSPHLNIINPAAGTIAYDTVTHQLAVFNGTVWSFWKP